MGQKTEIVQLTIQFKNLYETLQTFFEEFKSYQQSIETRLRALEDWKLTFVARFSVYASIALFLGSFLAQLLIKYIANLLLK